MESKLRCDLFVDNALVVELKSVSEFNPIFETQLLTDMNLLNSPIGLLINFNVKNILYEGQKTLENKLYTNLED